MLTRGVDTMTEIQHKIFPRRCDDCVFYENGCATHSDPDCVGCRRYISLKKMCKC